MVKVLLDSGVDGDQRELITNKGNNKWKKQNLWDVLQLYTKQVDTGWSNKQRELEKGGIKGEKLNNWKKL